MCPDEPDSDDSPFGLFQLADEQEQCEKFKKVATNEGGSTNSCDDDQYLDEASCTAEGHFWAPLSYSYYNNTETVARVPGFLQEDSNRDWCSLVEHQRTGFVRTEQLFKIIDELFTASPFVTMRTGCGVAQLVAVPLGTQNQIRIDPEAAALAENVACEAGTFDKVVVSANLGAVPLFKELVDPKLDRHLFGMKGYGLSGSTNDSGVETIQDANSGRGVHYIGHGKEFQAAYARAMLNDKVKIWGGHDASFTETAPPYKFCTPEAEDHIFENGPASAKDLIADQDTVKQTGMRPLPSLGQAPMIKRYEDEWENLFLNTGYGYNGYDLAWFSSMCTVDWLKTNTHNLDRCKEAAAIGKESSVWIGWYFILIITFLVIVVSLIICAIYPICYFCTKNKGCPFSCKYCMGCLYKCCWQPKLNEGTSPSRGGASHTNEAFSYKTTGGAVAKDMVDRGGNIGGATERGSASSMI